MLSSPPQVFFVVVLFYAGKNANDSKTLLNEREYYFHQIISYIKLKDPYTSQIKRLNYA